MTRRKDVKKDSEVRSEKFLNWVESIPNWVGSLFVGAVICGMIAGLTLAIVSTASSVAKTRCEVITAEIGYPTNRPPHPDARQGSFPITIEDEHGQRSGMVFPSE